MKYRTDDISDIALAGFLKMKGHKYTLKKLGRKGKFSFSKETQADIDSFFRNEGNFLQFSNEIRNLKTEIENVI